MQETLMQIGFILALISFVIFLVGMVLLFFESKRKIGLKIVLFSLIGFVIGFSTCAANFKLNMH